MGTEASTREPIAGGGIFPHCIMRVSRPFLSMTYPVMFWKIRKRIAYAAVSTAEPFPTDWW